MGVTVWEMVMICSSWGQVSPTAPVQGVSRVPDGVRPEEGELAAGLCDLGDLGHLHPVAPVASNAKSKWYVAIWKGSYKSCQHFVICIICG